MRHLAGDFICVTHTSVFRSTKWIIYVFCCEIKTNSKWHFGKLLSCPMSTTSYCIFVNRAIYLFLVPFSCCSSSIEALLPPDQFRSKNKLVFGKSTPRSVVKWNECSLWWGLFEPSNIVRLFSSPFSESAHSWPSNLFCCAINALL